MHHHWDYDLNFYPRNVAMQLLLERIHPTIRFHCAEADTRGFSCVSNLIRSRIPSFSSFFGSSSPFFSFDVLTRRERYFLKTCESSLWIFGRCLVRIVSKFHRYFSFFFFLFLKSIQVSTTKDHSNRQWCFFFFWKFEIFFIENIVRLRCHSIIEAYRLSMFLFEYFRGERTEIKKRNRAAFFQDKSRPFKLQKDPSRFV